MEDRATLRISSQLLGNWLEHGLIDRDDVTASMDRIAPRVDAQNAGDPDYRSLGSSDGTHARVPGGPRPHPGSGRAQPNGYTEPILHGYRRRAKAAIVMASTAGEARLLAELRAGRPQLVLGVRISRSTDVVRIAKSTGHHGIMIDLEHSTMSIDTAAHALRNGRRSRADRIRSRSRERLRGDRPTARRRRARHRRAAGRDRRAGRTPRRRVPIPTARSSLADGAVAPAGNGADAAHRTRADRRPGHDRQGAARVASRNRERRRHRGRRRHRHRRHRGERPHRRARNPRPVRRPSSEGRRTGGRVGRRVGREDRR